MMRKPSPTRPRFMPAFRLVTLGMLVLATTLGACGRIGPPHQPAGTRDYYRTYPSPDR
ncbi:hypothetical protein SXCC_04172 [Gluconacetobacter sp. SXCC-1]|uniref:Uncharacterized protein n=1 Tax=Komagataeibacter rhaeticus TaxID=215221 RepID=A0A181C926_9PROT|nr:hypothetical protein [Komagataeibacter rhaeticus]EGG75262.1 hypothetical protein SXCC_04172 [Gluconacetobacter sp. SXCC-1]QIP34954.1 hypothetical protein GWK63_05180 [Komagataeibacter rhaeticus]QOC47491.1 hypothetical protein ICJ78_05190 [Komagataeibacter rhaeticus]WPP21959.1 hypothetical protein SCD25_00085 [Komagataeibacter rhaeticus]SAY48070.1 hypothetical protein KRIGEM_01016 [Komagataeibacter rhaeticus]